VTRPTRHNHLKHAAVRLVAQDGAVSDGSETTYLTRCRLRRYCQERAFVSALVCAFWHARPYFFGLAAEPRLGRRTALTFPLLPPPQKNRSLPSDSSPDTPMPGGISSFSRTCPVRGSTRLTSLCSPSQVPCQSSPSIQVTPVTTRLDSMVRRMAPVSGSI